MVLTSHARPLVDHLKEQVKRRVEAIPGILQVVVEVLDEPWNLGPLHGTTEPA